MHLRMDPYGLQNGTHMARFLVLIIEGSACDYERLSDTYLCIYAYMRRSIYIHIYIHVYVYIYMRGATFTLPCPRQTELPIVVHVRGDCMAIGKHTMPHVYYVACECAVV